ncbi:hypothetical protein BT246_67530 (plasmid) [Bacillus thuringiensis]|uniref:Uncharacterized protein n=1 Tax=Bacillus thuringiensis TaxID=1428 RepID=A0A9W3SJK3_BACTU|nr:hypothetical protein [Bacillus thuringiensis]ANS52045.1 hypothetical protein BT246_67530 [Bacillus thuringiensis]
MKKIITGVLTLVIAAASLPLTTLAADHSDPVTKSGERLKYNTPYYLKDKNLPHKGGVTFEPWGLDDYVLFTHSSTNNGTPIIFENKNRTDGFIQSDDWIRIKSTQASTPESPYWSPDQLIDSVYLSSDDMTDHKIYGSSTDNSIGIGVFFQNKLGGSYEKEFWEYKGENADKAWMKPDLFLRVQELPLLSNRQTPFEIIEVSE